MKRAAILYGLAVITLFVAVPAIAGFILGQACR